MISYRRNGLREFYRIEGDLVVRVVNKEKQSCVDICDSWLIRSVATDEYSTKECTEQEFNEAYSIALDRIKTMKIA